MTLEDEAKMDRAWTLYVKYCLATLIGVVLLVVAFVVVMLALVGRARAADEPVCQTIVDWAFQYDIEWPEWVGYPEGWEGVDPETFEQAEMLILPFPDETGGYVLYRLPDGSDLIIPYYSWEVRATRDNLHLGNHDFCPVMHWLKAP